MSTLLEVNNLSRSFKDFKLDDVSFKLERGFIMGFIGPNGAGKSTTIKLIMNLIRRDAGKIKIFGLDNIKDEKSIKNKIGFVYDESHFYEDLTIKEIKSIIAPIYKHWDDKEYKKLIKEFELPEKRKIKELSKGMKMKFSLALALSHGAELLIMDEPTSGLDPLVRSELLDILGYVIQDENKGIFFSTHITSDLDKIADFITLLNKGKVIFTETKDEIMENHWIVKGGKDLLDRDLKKEFIGIKEHSYGFEALAQDKRKMINIFKDKIKIEKPTLEEIMLYYTKNTLKETSYV